MSRKSQLMRLDLSRAGLKKHHTNSIEINLVHVSWTDMLPLPPILTNGRDHGEVQETTALFWETSNMITHCLLPWFKPSSTNFSTPSQLHSLSSQPTTSVIMPKHHGSKPPSPTNAKSLATRTITLRMNEYYAHKPSPLPQLPSQSTMVHTLCLK